MKKALLIAIAAASALALASCGNPEKSSSTTDASTVSTTRATYGTRQSYELITKETGKYDDLSKLSGTYIETIDGKAENYIFINSIGNTVYTIGSKSPVPLGIQTSKEGIMVYRGSKTPIDTYVPYTFNGKVLKYTDDYGAHVWQKIDKVDIEGNYYLISDGRVVGSWTFDLEKGKVDLNHETVAKYKQTADKLIIQQDNGTITEYTYVYDLLSLVLKNGNETFEFRAS